MRRLALLLCAVACRAEANDSPPPAPVTFAPTTEQNAFLDTVQRRTFDWFWDLTNTSNGLVPDRWPTKSFSSIAAVGFGLTAYVVGVDRGYVPRADARTRVRTTLDF